MPGEGGDQPPPSGPGEGVGNQEAEGGDSPSAEDTVAFGEDPPATQEDGGQAGAPGLVEEAEGESSPTAGDGQEPTEGQAEATEGQGLGGEPPQLPSNKAAGQEERIGTMEKNMKELTDTVSDLADLVKGLVTSPKDNEGSINLGNNKNSLNNSNINISGTESGSVTQGDSGGRPILDGSFLTTIGTPGEMFAGERGTNTRYANNDQVVEFLKDPDGYMRLMMALCGTKGFTMNSPETDRRKQVREDKKRADNEAAEVGRKYIYDGRREKVTWINSATRMRAIYQREVPKKASITARVALVTEWMRGSAQRTAWNRFETKFHQRQEEISFNDNDYEIKKINNKEAENVDAVLDSIEEENGDQRFQLMSDAIDEFFEELILKDKPMADARQKRYKEKWDKWQWRPLTASPRDLWNHFDSERADQIQDVPVTVQPELLDPDTGKPLKIRVRKENQDENMKTVTTKWFQTMWASCPDFMNSWKSSMLLTMGIDVQFERVERILRYGHDRSRTSSDEYRKHREWVVKRIQRHYDDKKKELQEKEPKKNGNNKHKKKHGNGAGSSSAPGPPGDTLNINAVQTVQDQTERRAQLKKVRQAAYKKYPQFSFVDGDNYWDKDVKPKVSQTLIKLYKEGAIDFKEAKNLMHAFFLCKLCWKGHLIKDHQRADGFHEAVVEHEPGLVKSWSAKN